MAKSYEEVRKIFDDWAALCKSLKLSPYTPPDVVKAKAQQVMDNLEKAKARVKFLEREMAIMRGKIYA